MEAHRLMDRRAGRRWAPHEVSRLGGGREGGGQAGGGQTRRRGGTGFCKDERLVLGILIFDSCQILSWNPLLGALRILQPREMEKSDVRWSEPLLWETRKHQYISRHIGFRKVCLRESGRKAVSLK